MKRYFLSIRQYVWILPICLILTTVIGYGLAKAQPPVYQVSSILFVSGQSNPGNPFAQPLTSTDSIGIATNDAAQITSRSVMEYVANVYDKAHALKKLGFSADDLLADVTTVASSTAPTISITASGLNQSDPVTIANLVAGGYIAYSQNQIQQQVDQQRAVLQASLANYNNDKQNWQKQIVSIANPTDPILSIYQSNLQDDVHNIDLIEQQLLQLPAVVTPQVSVLQQAKAQDVAPVSRTTLIVGASALVGLLVGAAIMLALIFLDNRLRSEEEVKEKLGLAYVGGISKSGQIKSSPTQLSGKVSQEIADISVNLRLTGILAGQKQAPNGAVLLVTSTQTAEGKTSMAAALAVAVARGGNTVVVIDGNLRQPATHLAFGMGVAGMGLSGLLRSGGNVDEAVQRSKVQNVWLLPGGTPVEDSGTLLEQKLPVALAGLRKKADLVIIDGPSLLSGADASVMAAMADGVLLVVDVKHAKLPLLLRAKEVLISLAHKPAGVVMNRFARRQKDHYFATTFDESIRSEKVQPVAGLGNSDKHDGMNGMNGVNGGSAGNGQRAEAGYKNGNGQQPDPMVGMGASMISMPPMPPSPSSYSLTSAPTYPVTGAGTLDMPMNPPPASPRDFPRIPSNPPSSPSLTGDNGNSTTKAGGWLSPNPLTPPPMTGDNGANTKQAGGRVPPTPPSPRRPS